LILVTLRDRLDLLNRHAATGVDAKLPCSPGESKFISVFLNTAAYCIPFSSLCWLDTIVFYMQQFVLCVFHGAVSVVQESSPCVRDNIACRAQQSSLCSLPDTVSDILLTCLRCLPDIVWLTPRGSDGGSSRAFGESQAFTWESILPGRRRYGSSALTRIRPSKP
jgi:hypothetical protein